MTPTELLSYASAVAGDSLETFVDCDGGDHHRGALLSCPKCWAFHTAAKQPGADARLTIIRALQEASELAGEQRLDAVAADLARFYAAPPAPPTQLEFWTGLAGAVARAVTGVMPSSRRRRTIAQLAAIFVTDPGVPVGPVS